MKPISFKICLSVLLNSTFSSAYFCLKNAISNTYKDDKRASYPIKNPILTFEPRSRCSIGKFSLLHSMRWRTMRTCLAFLGVSSSFDASQTQLAATFCKGYHDQINFWISILQEHIEENFYLQSRQKRLLEILPQEMRNERTKNRLK